MALDRVAVEPIFGDFAELEHVCNLMREQAEVAGVLAGHPGHENGPVQVLRKRMHKQWDGQACEIEARHPGLFVRTYLASTYAETDEVLERIERFPSVLPGELPRLEVLMHKLYIFSLLTPEDIQKEVQQRKSQQTSEAAKVSHDGRTKMREEAHKLFLAAPNPWESISAAASEIAPKICTMKVSRPLAKSNAQRTVREWLRAFVASNSTAADKLTQPARARLKVSGPIR